MRDAALKNEIRCLVVSAGSWHLGHSAKGFEHHGVLAELWLSDKNKVGVEGRRFRQAKPFFWITKPMYLVLSPHWNEWWFWRMTWLWRAWVRAQKFPVFNVIHVRQGFGMGVFDAADRVGALKVIDYCNSHPASLLGCWQRECDLWAPGIQPAMPRRIFREMNREIPRADLHLCPSDFVRESLVRNGVSPAKCVVHPFGYDPVVFSTVTAQKRRPRFVFTGAICLRKGCQYLLPAFARIKEQVPEVELMLIGGVTQEFAPLFERWKNLVTHVPWVPQTRVAELMRESLAFVMPSMEEGMARVLIEAMACGLPLIASFESGATPLGTPGRELFLVNPHDENDIAEKMLRMIREPGLAEASSIAALERARVIGSWAEYSGRVLVDYDRFLEAKRAGVAAR